MVYSVAVSLAWNAAAAEAAALNHSFLEREHLFIGLCSLDKLVRFHERRKDLEPGELASLRLESEVLLDVFHAQAIAPQDLRRRVRQRMEPGPSARADASIRRSRRTRNVFTQAEQLALPHHTTSLHLLAALFDKPGTVIREALKEQRTEPDILRKKLIAQLMAGAAALLRQAPAVRAPVSASPYKPPPGFAENRPPQKDSPPSVQASSQPYLVRYGTDLVQEAEEGRLQVISGRRTVLLQLIQTLARSTKSNPMLVGEPGVGKTAVIEALAHRLAHGKDHVLKGCRLVQLNTGSLLGGTTLRGELEERVEGLLQELRSRPEIILFIDEIHAFLGNREVADIFKPALARGQIRCIGATTLDEYRRYIEKDAALERRFEKVMVPEPSRDECIDILKALRTRLEKLHNVRILDEAVTAAIDLSIRFDLDHRLPDKAIDLLDMAAARTAVPELSMIVESQPDGASLMLQNEPRQVTAFDVAEVLSEKAGVPAEVISGQLMDTVGARLLEMEAYLRERIHGQDDAISRVCRRLQLTRVGLTHRRGPLGVFLFLGPSGVGKTELAKSVAAFLFGDPDRMIRLDMSEYQEAHNVSKLIGSPPGYVGSEEEGQLTGKLRTTPYTVVLLDEIEKGHPRVYDLFLQVFDEGRLTDNKGRTVDARNAIFIMTSNLQPDAADGGLTTWFRPEFVNRVDDVITFQALGEVHIRRILQDTLGEIRRTLQERYGVVLTITDEAEKLLARKGYNPVYGARELRRTVEQHLVVPVTQHLMEGRLQQHPEWLVRADGDHLVLEPVSKQ
jgi:ATP-dependent Clp protease ATP-binding subunit ClpC